MDIYNRIRSGFGITYRLKRLKEALFLDREQESARRYSYSQQGEDLMIAFKLRGLKRKRISYIDIGAYSPYDLSNTALLDEIFEIEKGVLVEPNYESFKKIKEKRRNAICENVGVCGNTQTEQKELTYYMFLPATINTFSKQEADEMIARGWGKLIGTRNVPIENINDMMQKHFGNTRVDVMSIDVEGMDSEILRALDYERFAPRIICVEEDMGDGNTIEGFLTEKGYKIFGKNSINTLYFKE